MSKARFEPAFWTPDGRAPILCSAPGCLHVKERGSDSCWLHAELTSHACARCGARVYSWETRCPGCDANRTVNEPPRPPRTTRTGAPR